MATHARHEQISAWIRGKIRDGSVGVGEQLPSENQLCQQFGVSRITVRRGLQTLESEGLIERQQGLGSFVADTKARRGQARLTDAATDLDAAGLTPAKEILERDTIDAPDDVRTALSVDPDTPVFRVDLLWSGNGEPLFVEQTWMTMMFAEMLADDVGSWERLFDVLSERYKIDVSRGYIDISSINAPNDIARHLSVPWGRALLLLERTFFTGSERPFLYQKRFYRCDRISYRLVLSQMADQRHTPPGHLPMSAFDLLLHDAPS